MLICQATPRKWLESGKQIRIERAPTYYGLLNLTISSRAEANEISATVDLEQRKRPTALLVRLRHPLALPMQSVSVNGKKWIDFDVGKEWIRIPNPTESHYKILVRY